MHIHTHPTHTYTYILTSQHLTMVFLAHDSDVTCSYGSRFNWERAPRNTFSSPPLLRKRANSDVTWFIRLLLAEKKQSLLAYSSHPPCYANMVRPVCPRFPLILLLVQKGCKRKTKNHHFFPKVISLIFSNGFETIIKLGLRSWEKLAKSLLQERTAC